MTAQDEGRSAPQLLAQGSGPDAVQHPADEFCFFCVPDEIALRGVDSYDRGEPYQGPTVHWQVPESFCPHFVEEVDES